MKLLLNIFIGLTIVFLVNCNDNKITDNSKVSISSNYNIKFPTNATLKHLDEFNEDSLVSTINNISFLITARGKLFWGQNPADTLQLIADEIIEKAYLYKHSDTLFIFYTETDYEGATSRIVKVNLNTRQTIWSAEIPGFNLSMPYIIDNFTYVTSVGFVGKIDLISGKYQYKFDSLYDRGAFNSFDSIIFNNELVYFISKQFRKTIPDTIIVNEKTKQVTKKNAL